MRSDIKVMSEGLIITDIKKNIFFQNKNHEEILIKWEDIYSIEYDYSVISISLNSSDEIIKIKTSEETNDDFEEIVRFRKENRTNGNRFEVYIIDENTDKKVIFEAGV